MPSQKVLDVFNVIITDDALLVDFWTVIEKAVRKANVGDFTADDCAELIQYMGQMTGSLIEARPGGIHK